MAVGAVMGIYDREYYRDDSRSLGWFSGPEPACRTIILINIVIFVAQWVFPDLQLEEKLHANSREIFRQFHPWELLTASFVHDPNNIFSILWNMLFLWMVGREMEAMYGSREFTCMYLTAAVFSNFCWAVVDLLGANGGEAVQFGAFGAVIAIVVLYTLYYPRREVLLFFVLPVEMWVILAVYLGFNTFQFLSQIRGGVGAPGVRAAFAAELGGATYGYLYKTFDLRWSHLLERRRRPPRLRVVSAEPRDRVSSPSGSNNRSASASSNRPTATPTFPEEQEQFDERLDEVLAKIAREGRAGLTEEENRILQEASRRARDRRSDRP